MGNDCIGKSSNEDVGKKQLEYPTAKKINAIKTGVYSYPSGRLHQK